jgi:hypothetical protein
LVLELFDILDGELRYEIELQIIILLVITQEELLNKTNALVRAIRKNITIL